MQYTAIQSGSPSPMIIQSQEPKVERKAITEEARAEFDAGLRYFQDTGAEQNAELGAEHLSKAHFLHHPDALTELTKSAEAGNQYSAIQINQIYLSKPNYSEEDIDIINKFHRLAEQLKIKSMLPDLENSSIHHNNPDSSFDIGMCHLKHPGEESQNEAIKYFTLAYQQGHKTAFDYISEA